MKVSIDLRIFRSTTEDDGTNEKESKEPKQQKQRKENQRMKKPTKTYNRKKSHLLLHFKMFQMSDKQAINNHKIVCLREFIKT